MVLADKEVVRLHKYNIDYQIYTNIRFIYILLCMHNTPQNFAFWGPSKIKE